MLTLVQRVFWNPFDARGEPHAHRHPAERVHRGGRPRRPHGLDRRPAQRRPRPASARRSSALQEGRRRQAAGQVATRGAPRHDAGPSCSSRHADLLVDRAGDRARADGLPHPARSRPSRRGLRRWFATLALAGVAGSLYFLLEALRAGRPSAAASRPRPLTLLIGLFLGAAAAAWRSSSPSPTSSARARRRASSTPCCSGATSASRS